MDHLEAKRLKQNPDPNPLEKPDQELRLKKNQLRLRSWDLDKLDPAEASNAERGYHLQILKLDTQTFPMQYGVTAQSKLIHQ